MNVTLLTAGSRGDVQPYVALGTGLKAAGHQVCVATNESFRDLVRDYDLEFAPVTQTAAEVAASPTWQRWQRSGDDFASYIMGFFRVTRRSSAVIRAMLDDFWLACQETDLIISSTSGFGGPQIAEALGVHHCWALFQPMSRTRVFPHFMTPRGWDLGPRLNYATYQLAERIYWWLFKPMLNEWLEQTLGRPRLRRPHPDTFLGEEPSLTLYGFSRHVIPRPDDWGEHIQVCGYWFLPDLDEWQPDEECRAFLAQAPAPIYFYLSGINYAPRAELIDLVLEALRRTGQRGLLFLGFDDDDQREFPPFALPVRNIPHNWLFPRVAAVVHHGGAGTTASILRAGVPSVGVPGYWDQPFWSRRVHALGAGPEAIPVKRLNVESLTAAIEEMLASPAMRRRAGELGEQIRQENGVEQAVKRLEKHCAGTDRDREVQRALESGAHR